MIGSHVRELLLERKNEFMIDGEKIASLRADNPLTHAVLVLSKVRYAKIPVLDNEERFVGLIGLTDIMDIMFDLEGVNPSLLEGRFVKEAMEKDIPTLRADFDLEDLLHLLVDNSFIPVVDDEGRFIGIYTRREILKAVNRMAHQLESIYQVEEKDSQKQYKIV